MRHLVCTCVLDAESTRQLDRLLSLVRTGPSKLAEPCFQAWTACPPGESIACTRQMLSTNTVNARVLLIIFAKQKLQAVYADSS